MVWGPFFLGLGGLEDCVEVCDFGRNWVVEGPFSWDSGTTEGA